MKIQIKFFFGICFLFLGLQFDACNGDEGVVMPVSSNFQSGIFITNEGMFQQGTGTVSFYDRQTGEVTHKIFQKANGGDELGNIVQSMYVRSGKAYIVVNNADRVVAVDAKTFELQGVITGLGFPRYFLAVDNTTAFVSQWKTDGDISKGSVAVVNLNTLAVERVILTGEGSEKMVLKDGRVYVANGGFLGRDSTVAVIDIQSLEVVGKIVVGDDPESIQVDKNGAIWVICKGHTEDFADPNNPLNTKGSLVKIENEVVTKSFELDNGAGNLVISPAGDRLFYTLNGFQGIIFLHSIDQNELSGSRFVEGFFYHLGIDSPTGNLLASDAKDFSSNGEVLVFDENGILVKTIQAGIIPGNFLGL